VNAIALVFILLRLTLHYSRRSFLWPMLEQHLAKQWLGHDCDRHVLQKRCWCLLAVGDCQPIYSVPKQSQEKAKSRKSKADCFNDHWVQTRAT